MQEDFYFEPQYPADAIKEDVEAMEVHDVVHYTMSHRSPGYPTFYTRIERVAADDFSVELKREQPMHLKRGGPPPDAGKVYTTVKLLCSAQQVHAFLREEVPYTSFKAHLQSRRTGAQRKAEQAELPTALFRFSASRNTWGEVAPAVEPLLHKSGRLEVKGAPEPNSIPVSLPTLNFEGETLRLTFPASGSIWAIRFGTRRAFEAMREAHALAASW